MKRVLRSISICLFVMSIAALAFAADASSLKPPPGARVAIIVFEDLQCPDCARAYPMVWEAAKAHNVPVVLHDFPLPMHNWSFDAAVYARFFDTKSEKVGNDFRGFIYKNQTQITPENLRAYVQKFADENKVPLPFVIDPQGKLKEKVQADYTLGQRIVVEHTPTIFVVGNGVGASSPYVEVVDRQKLADDIEDVLKKSKAPTPATPTKKTSTKAAAKKAG